MIFLIHHLVVRAHYYRWREPHRDAYDKAQTHLSGNFVFTFQSFFVVELELAVIVEETDDSHPEGGHYHQNHIDIPEIAHQQARNQYGEYYYQAAHGGSAGLLHLSLQSEIADGLAYLAALQPVDDHASEDECRQHGQRKRYAGAERDVVHQVVPREVGAGKLLKQSVYHSGVVSLCVEMFFKEQVLKIQTLRRSQWGPVRAGRELRLLLRGRRNDGVRR